MLTPNGGKLISELKRYYCGYCVNSMSRLFADYPDVKCRFYAAVWLFKHNEEYYLFDTGYSTRIYNSSWQSKVYNFLNPVFCEAGDNLSEQLRQDDIYPTQIKAIFLSHLHPDHVGGLYDFTRVPIIISKNCYETFTHPKLSDLVFKELFPADFADWLEVVTLESDYDYFGDGSLILKDLSGHTHGQMGLYFTESQTILAADSCFGVDLLHHPMTHLAKWLQKDYRTYQKTAAILNRMHQQGVSVIASHEERK